MTPDSPVNLLQNADQLFQSRNYKKARLLYLQILESPRNETDIDQETRLEAMAQLARTYLILDEKEHGRNWLTRTAELVNPDNYPKAWARYLGVLGRFQWKDSNLATATATFKTMYDFCNKNKLYDHAVDAAHMIAITAPQNEQITWAKRGIEAAQKGNMTNWLGPLYNNLGWSYDEMGKHKQALDALQNARKYHYQNKNELPKLIADYSIAVQYRKLSNINKALKWLTPAQEWADKLYNQNPTQDHAEWVGHTHSELAEIALLQNNINQAKKQFAIALEKLKEAKMPDWDPDAFNELKQKQSQLSND